MVKVILKVRTDARKEENNTESQEMPFTTLRNLFVESSDRDPNPENYVFRNSHDSLHDVEINLNTLIGRATSTLTRHPSYNTTAATRASSSSSYSSPPKPPPAAPAAATSSAGSLPASSRRT